MDSTPRDGRLLHPATWTVRDDRDYAAENFFQGGSPKQATPLTAPATSLTTKNRFTANFRGWRLDEDLKPKSPPYGGGPHTKARRQRQNGSACLYPLPPTRGPHRRSVERQK